MKWIITKDEIDDGLNEHNADAVSSFMNYVEETIMFRLIDGDEEVYYYGIADIKVYNTEEGFEPLDEFGIGSGCVEIQYYVNNEWVIL